MRKTKFDSYSIGRMPKGCRLCLQGRKLVLFITGKCSRNCNYCSLSSKRKKKDIVWANERICHSSEDAVQEVLESNAKGAGITGGDPLKVLHRTLNYTRVLKKHFGKKFHIHIYLPTKDVSIGNLKELMKSGVDEIRFHPNFLDKNFHKEINKIKLTSLFFDKEHVGIELPILPDKIQETFNFMKEVAPSIGFINLNEMEISDTNFDYVTKKYKMTEDTYTIAGSRESGLKLLKKCKKNPLLKKLKIHLCTARTKNLWQYKNRLKLRKILPFGLRTKNGAVRYFAIYFKDNSKSKIKKIEKRFRHQTYWDEKNKRIIISESIVPKLLKNKFKIARVEEMPTFDSTVLEQGYL
jgi:hypothetical protein